MRSQNYLGLPFCKVPEYHLFDSPYLQSGRCLEACLLTFGYRKLIQQGTRENTNYHYFTLKLHIMYLHVLGIKYKIIHEDLQLHLRKKSS